MIRSGKQLKPYEPLDITTYTDFEFVEKIVDTNISSIKNKRNRILDTIKDMI